VAAVLVTGTRAEAMRAAMEACCCGSGSGSGSGSVVLCDLTLTSLGSIAVVSLDGTGSPGTDPMFGAWSGLPLQTGQAIFSDVSFDNYDIATATLVNTTFGAPPFFTNGSNYQIGSIFGTCSTNNIGTSECYGYQTPWTAFDSGGALEFKHIYLVSKVTSTVLVPPSVQESCVYNFWTVVRGGSGDPTFVWYFGLTSSFAQLNRWCSGSTGLYSVLTPLVNSNLGTDCSGLFGFASSGRSIEKPYYGGADAGPCYNWFAGPS